MKILVAYASGYGTTEEIAREVAATLGKHHEVELSAVGTVHSVEPYDAVVLGSSLRAGRWMAGLVRFLRQFCPALAGKPVALFAVGLTARTHEGSRKVLAESLPKLFQRCPGLQPCATEAFGGALHFDKYNLAVRTLMRAVAKHEGLPASGLVDLRDWDAIRQWAEELSAKLPEAAGD